MRFFKPELWEKINSEIDSEREKANKNWESNEDIYLPLFEEAKQYIPEKSLKIYFNNDGFHDYLLTEIKVLQESVDIENSVSVYLKLNHGSENWLIHYGCVVQTHFEFIAEKELPFLKHENEEGWEQWGYDELLYMGNNILSHEILFASGRSIFIKFQTIEITEI